MNLYARIINQYKYQMQKRPGDNLWPRDGNLGDCIQALAVENIYKKAGIDISSVSLINRDDIKNYNGEKGYLVMQSWFGDYANVFPLPWSDKIFPIFLGFHLSNINHTRERFIQEKIYKKMKTYEPIGCRDRNTRDFLQSCGINAYFSGCLTLTFDKRKTEPKNGTIFIVDLDKKTAKKLPKEFSQTADYSISHFYYWNEYPVTEKGAAEFEEHARYILKRYENEAKLVITSKIHVAMPCVAMGIPVIFITDNPNNERFDVLKGILPLYSYKDMKYVNWNPKPADISSLKAAIIANAIAQIKNPEEKNMETVTSLNAVTEILKPINFLPVYIKALRYIQYLFSKQYRKKLFKALQQLLLPPPPPLFKKNLK